MEADFSKYASDFVKLNELTQEKEAAEQQLEEKMERWMYLEDLAARIERGEENWQLKSFSKGDRKKDSPDEELSLRMLKGFDWSLLSSLLFLPLIHNFNAATTIMRLDDGQLLGNAFFHVVHVTDDTDHTVFANLF